VYPVDRHNWGWLEFNAIQYDAIERLQDPITKKSQMHAACLRECDECWLLIVANSFLSSGNSHPDATSLSHVCTSPFSCIYFLDLVLGRIARLNTKPGL
jgi:hypothetical protein